MLQAEPGRFGALYGAARAAELSGRADLARRLYGQLAEAASGRQRDEVHHAQGYLLRSSDMDKLDK